MACNALLQKEVMKMKVCFVSHSSAKGGAERVLLELIGAPRAVGKLFGIFLNAFTEMLIAEEERR